jgi:hypothetical protein
MTLQQAVILTRLKYLEERGGATGETAGRYAEAAAAYPVTMAIALHVFAAEAMQGT